MCRPRSCGRGRGLDRGAGTRFRPHCAGQAGHESKRRRRGAAGGGGGAPLTTFFLVSALTAFCSSFLVFSCSALEAPLVAALVVVLAIAAGASADGGGGGGGGSGDGGQRGRGE
eukprot:363348-Chlamydomonas_euryale.AAC.5